MVRSEGSMSLKNPVTPPGIDPGTVRLVAQHLKQYATSGPFVHHLEFQIHVGFCTFEALKNNQNANQAVMHVICADPDGRSVYSVGLRHLMVGIAGSNPAEVMDICLLCLLCDV
jgi:hypothetical protein